MTAAAIDASPNAHPLRRLAVRSLVIGVAAAALLAFVGALGTDAAPFISRLVYWAAVILPASLIGMAVREGMRSWGRLAHNRAAEIGVIALLISVPHSFMVIVATALFFGMSAITPAVVLNFWFAVLVVSLVLTTINYLSAKDEEAPSPPSLAAQPHPEPANAPPSLAEAVPEADPSPLPEVPVLIAEKLPARLCGARLIGIAAEDHYLRIYTDAGSDLVLMRMGDACALLPDSAGARVHRSWWVAKGAVEGHGRQSSKMALTLTGGLTVPVSRSMQAALREQGWV